MQTTTKWTQNLSETLLMGPRVVPKKVLLKQKFKIDLVFLISSFSLSVKGKSMQTHADHYWMDPRTLWDPTYGSLRGPKEFFTLEKKLENFQETN